MRAWRCHWPARSDQLFYLLARGINPELGKSLLTYGFAEEVIEKIGIESIRTQLDKADDELAAHAIGAKLSNTMVSTVDALVTPEIGESWDVERFALTFPCFIRR